MEGPGFGDCRPTLVAWKTVCRPKSQGGLGVMDIFTHNKTLLMKNLHKFFNKHDIPWVNLVWETYYSTGNLPGNSREGSFWWKSHISLLAKFKKICRCTIGNGQTFLFWKDWWKEHSLQSILPHLHSFALNDEQSVQAFLGRMIGLSISTCPSLWKPMRNLINSKL